MTGNLSRRLATVATTALLGTMLLGVGTASASTPGWKTSDVTYIPTDHVVAPGANAGYVVTLRNTGKSTITALSLTTDIPATAPNGGAPTYVGLVTYTGQTGSGFCSLANSGPLTCSFGSLVAGATVSVTVGFLTPTTGAGCTPASSSAYCFNFKAFGNGSTTSDGGTSHGDALILPTRVTLNANANFAGGFDLDGSPVANTGTLGRSNVQNTAVDPPTTSTPIAVTVEDGPGAVSACQAVPIGVPVIGECSKVNVNYSDPYPAFKVVITIDGSGVPGGVSTSDFYLVQTSDDGLTTSTVGENGVRCTFTGTSQTPTNAPCITVTKIGNNYQVIAWLLHNGGLRLQ